jgi:hypothetical protein
VTPRQVKALGQKISDFVREEGVVPWCKLVAEFPEMTGGDLMLGGTDNAGNKHNVVLWNGLTELGHRAIDYAMCAGLVRPRRPLKREVDLMRLVPALPLSGDFEPKETPHWFSTVLVYGKAWEDD